MTIPKSFHDETTPTENLPRFIISDLLQITILAKYFSMLAFPNTGIGRVIERYRSEYDKLFSLFSVLLSQSESQL